MKKKFFDKSLFKITSSVGTVSLFSLTIPLMFENIMNRLQGMVNTAVLSGYSETAVAAVGAVNTVIAVILLVGTVIAMGATVVLSNYIGAEEIEKAEEASFAVILVGLIISVVITPLLLFFSDELMTLLNLSGEIYKNALTYFNIRILFITFSMVMSSVLAVLKCYGYPKYTFVVGLLINILNLVLNVYVIYFPRYSPVTGVAGVAYSCCASNLIGLIVSFIILYKVKIKLRIPQSFKALHTHISRIMAIGVPGGVSSAAFTFSQMVTTAFVAQIGDYALSAKVYYENILGFVYLFSSGAGNANAILIGRRYGAGEFDAMTQMNRQLTKITLIVNTTVSLVVLVLYRQLVGLFTDNDMIIRLSVAIFTVDIIVEQARAISHIYEYALRATGDVMFFMVAMTASCFIFSIGLSYVLAIQFNMGLVGCWIGLAADESIRAMVSYFRWRGEKWKTQLMSR